MLPLGIPIPSLLSKLKYYNGHEKTCPSRPWALLHFGGASSRGAASPLAQEVDFGHALVKC